MAKRNTFRLDIPYYVEVWVTFGLGSYRRYKVMNISETGLRFAAPQKVEEGEKKKAYLHFPFLFDPIPLDVEIVRVFEKDGLADENEKIKIQKPVSNSDEQTGQKASWEVACQFLKLTMGMEDMLFRHVRVLERRDIAYRKSGFPRVELPEDMKVYITFGEEWFKARYKVKDFSENGILFTSFHNLDVGTQKSTYLHFPWRGKPYTLNIGVVRIFEVNPKEKHKSKTTYGIGCRIENLSLEMQETLYEEILYMESKGISLKKRVPPGKPGKG